MNKFSISKMTTLLSFVMVTGASAEMPNWSYDAGPDPTTAMGRELIDITASIPNMPAVSKKLMGRKQKFRPAFGPIPWRMRQESNAVKILFIGQDGTHIAEAAGRPATAGFGGRAQDFANFFGVNEGAAFMNAYSFTIKGQYGIYGSPYVYKKGAKPSVKTANLVSNSLWLMSNNLNSPIVKWRNTLIDWVIRNNKKSMKLVVLFGGAARDAIASYALSKDGVDGNTVSVSARMQKDMNKIQVPETKEQYAGGNNTFPSILAPDGKDLYSEMVGRKLVYKNSKDQKAALKSLKENLLEYMQKAVFTKGGPSSNGLLNAAQLGGYNLDSLMVNGIKTRSLKGLTLNDGTKIENDIIVISLPHPSSLSRTVMDAKSYGAGKIAANKRVMKDVAKLTKFKKLGWEIKADSGKINHYHVGDAYQYGRADIGPEFYDFGTPKNRMVSKSTAKRMSGNANVVILGTRDNGQFSKTEIAKMTNVKMPLGVNPESLYIAKPSAIADRYTFDPGPGMEMAKIMIENLDEDSIFTPKEGMSFEKDGIAAYNVKTHPKVSDFGHYRGTFKAPRAIIIADPSGYDDLVTARALTGSRGQYLHGLMEDMGVGNDYLVIKTVPYGMEDATEAEWKIVIEQTKVYREKIIAAVLATGRPSVIIGDGKYGALEAQRIFKNRKVVSMARDGAIHSAGIKEAGIEIAKELNSRKKAKVKMVNIPREHLSFYSRVWEGTSGDRMITSRGIQYKGIAFAEVVPKWAYGQELELTDETKESIRDSIEVIRENRLPLPGESIPKYLRRTEIDPSIGFVQALRTWFKLIA